MSSDLKINELNKLAPSSLVDKKENDSNRDLLREFSDILSKITSAVKTAKQDAEKSVAEVKPAEVKKSEKSEPDYRKFEETSETKYPKDTFIMRDEVEAEYQKVEAEPKSEENSKLVKKETKNTEEVETENSKDVEEAPKESEAKQVKEATSEKVVESKTESELEPEVEVKPEKEVKPEQVLVTNGENKEVVQAKEEVKTIETPKVTHSKEEKEVIKEDAFVYKENTKLETGEAKKEITNNTNQEIKFKSNEEIDSSKENVELKNQIKQEIVNQLDKKEVKTTSNQQEVIQGEEKIGLKSEVALEKNIANVKLEVAQNVANQALVNPQDKIMKSMIEQAKNILVKQFEYNINSNPNFASTNQGSANTIQNVQASLASKNNNLASKGKALPLPKTYATRTMHKVEEIIKELSKAKDGKTISVRLDPPSLGNLKVDVSLKDGGIVARVTAESTQVGQFLKDKAVELQQLLRKSGINVDDVNVWLGSQSEFSEPETRRDFEDFNQEFFDNTNDEFDDVELASLNSANNKEVELDHWVA